MRVLSFDVNGQQISKKTDCNFSGLVTGTRNYLQAHFSFSPDWDGCVIVVSFWKGSNEYAVPIKDNMCVIPSEVLTRKSYGISVIGQRGDYRITTNRIYIRQEGRN